MVASGKSNTRRVEGNTRNNGKPAVQPHADADGPQASRFISRRAGPRHGKAVGVLARRHRWSSAASGWGVRELQAKVRALARSVARRPRAGGFHVGSCRSVSRQRGDCRVWSAGARRCEISGEELNDSWYDRHILPYLIDIACGVKAVRRQREKVVPLVDGCVLEVGIGTGLNMRHYDRSRVAKIVGLDPAMPMHRLARKRIARAGLDVELVGLSAEKIPFDDASFDSVLLTYTLCSIRDPVAALREMRRVLTPAGRLAFCEHGRAPDAAVRRWQDRLTPHWKKFAGGCHLNRDIPAMLIEAGFECRDLQTMYLPGPRPLTFNYWGEAFAA